MRGCVTEFDQLLRLDHNSPDDVKRTAFRMARCFCATGVLFDCTKLATDMVGIEDDMLLKNMLPSKIAETICASTQDEGGNIYHRLVNPDSTELQMALKSLSLSIESDPELTSIGHQQSPKIPEGLLIPPLILQKIQPSTPIATAIVSTYIPAVLFRLMLLPAQHRSSLAIRALAVGFLLLTGTIKIDKRKYQPIMSNKLNDPIATVIRTYAAYKGSLYGLLRGDEILDHKTAGSLCRMLLKDGAASPIALYAAEERVSRL